MRSSQPELSRRPMSGCFNLLFPFEAQGLYKATSFLPFYAYTLRGLILRCCRVSLQPGLVGQNSISFSGLQGAETIVNKPDCNEKPTA